jgi:arginyl-tRNA synthetase
MDYVQERFTAEVKAAIAATGLVPPALIELTTPKSNIPADLAFPAHRAAKERGLAPPQLAAELATAIQPGEGSLIGSVAAAGPFLNFSMHPERLAAAVLREIGERGERYGHHEDGAGKRIVIDYSAPNIARRMHVGHIRSTIIGQTLVNIFRGLGYTVIGDNHLGDWGTQFGTVIGSIMRYGKPEGEGEAAIEQLETLYARYNNEPSRSSTRPRATRPPPSTPTSRPRPAAGHSPWSRAIRRPGRSGSGAWTSRCRRPSATTTASASASTTPTARASTSPCSPG